MLSLRIPSIKSNKTTHTVLIFFLCVITFISFQNVLKNDFINWDDPRHILEQEQVRSLSLANLKRIFTENVNTTYIPLSILSFATEYHFVKYQPFLYHLDNLLLHLGVIVLIYFFALKLGLTPVAACLASIIFGVHPMHVESVAWATERKDVLYSIFYLLALISYLQFITSQRKGKYYILTLTFGLISMLSKPMALTLPLILLLIDWYKKEEKMGFCLLNKIPFLIYIIPLARLTHAENLSAYAMDSNLWHAVQISIWCFSFYLYKFFFPIHFIPHYEIPEPGMFLQPPYLLAFVIFFSFLYLYKQRSSDKLLIFSLMYYLASIFLLLRFDRVNQLDGVSDRFMYLPSLGFCLYIGFKLEQFISKHSKIAFVPVICLIVFLSWKTFHQTSVWKDSLTLWNYVIRQSPLENENRPRLFYAMTVPPMLDKVYFLRGQEYARQENYPKAIEDFKKSIELDSSKTLKNVLPHMETNPRVASAFYNLGNLYFKVGDLNQSIEKFSRAIDLNPKFVSAYQNRGAAQLSMGKYEAALIDYNKAILLDPDTADLFYSRGTLFGLSKQYQSALSDFNHAIQLNPNNPSYYNNRAVVYNLLNRRDLASADINKVQLLQY